MSLSVGQWAILGVAFLADVASPGSCVCGSDPPPSPPRVALAITVSDCTCAPDPITVEIDAVQRGTLSCSSKQPLVVYLSLGPHEVSAMSPGRTWTIRKVEVNPAMPPQLDLGCPSQ